LTGEQVFQKVAKMGKVMRTPPLDLFHEQNRFPGGIAFLILIAVSIALWAGLIAFIA
jgi:hypothetical protein